MSAPPPSSTLFPYTTLFRSVDGRGGRLVVKRAGVGRDAPGRNGAAPQGPQKLAVPVLAQLVGFFDIGQRASHPPERAVYVLINRCPRFCPETVLHVPDVQRSFLKGNIRKRRRQSFCRNTHAATS